MLWTVFEKSLFGERLTVRSGIEELMEDLGHALAEAGGTVRMLGGGNPALIPAVEARWRRRMKEILADGDRFERMMGVYDPPKGNSRFALALAGFLQREYGWNVGAENIAITGGGQTAFFYLFNLLAGDFRDGGRKRVLLPIVPEYIGYANQGLGRDFFTGVPPEIGFTGPHAFKYRVDFERLELTPDIGAGEESRVGAGGKSRVGAGEKSRVGAICISRPTNPSGNVLTDKEVQHLDRIAREAEVPLIIDNAYGAPFPGIVFGDITPIWNENIILTLSLSKLGLPGTRTGIVVARPEIVHAIASMTAIVGLANGTIGQAIVTPMIESGEIRQMVSEEIRPFYQRKAENARAWISEAFEDGLDYFVHASEGALFLWIWFRGMPISATELYRRLKARGVLIVPGHYFGFGSPEAERHASECIRLSFAMEDGVVREGIGILAEEVARAYREG